MQIMNKISLDNTIKENATSVVDIFDDCVTKIRFKEGFTKSILYHTADIWLSKGVYNYSYGCFCCNT